MFWTLWHRLHARRTWRITEMNHLNVEVIPWWRCCEFVDQIWSKILSISVLTSHNGQSMAKQSLCCYYRAAMTRVVAARAYIGWCRMANHFCLALRPKQLRLHRKSMDCRRDRFQRRDSISIYRKFVRWAFSNDFVAIAVFLMTHWFDRMR